MKYLISTAILFTVIVSMAYGHGLGQYLEKAVGDFVIDVDYDSYFPEIDSKTAVRFSFNIWNKDRTEPREFTDLWVRIAPQNGSGILFAGNLAQLEFGPAGFSYAFEKGGSYELTVRFQKEGKALHDDVFFPLTVVGEGGNTPGSYRNFILSMIIGVMVGVALTFFLRNKAS